MAMSVMSEYAVAIPTFNRCAELEQRIEELLPQLGAGWKLWIFNNGSSDGTGSLLEKIAGNSDILIRSSMDNLGMCRNFGRCFEEVQSNWLWILGDDDPVRPDSLSQIERVILKNSNCCAINFTTDCSYNSRDDRIRDLDDLFRLKDVTSLMHLSSNIYQLPLLQKSLHVLAPSGFTYAPHVAIMFNALERQGHPIALLKDRFLDEKPNKLRWSGADVALGLSLFPEFIHSERHRKMAAHAVRHATRWMINWALSEINIAENAGRWKRLVRQVDGNLAAYGSGRIAGAFFLARKSRTDFRRDFLMRILSIMPDGIVFFFADKMKRRTQNIRGEILKENQ